MPESIQLEPDVNWSAFEENLEKALRSIFKALEDNSPLPESPKVYYHKERDDGRISSYAQVPLYSFAREAIWEAIKLPEPQRLIDFLWSERTHYWPASSNWSDEESFRFNIPRIYLYNPIFFALVDLSNRQLAETGSVVHFGISEKEISEAVDDVVEDQKNLMAGQSRIRGYAFVSEVFTDSETLEFGKGIRIRRLEGVERAYHQTRNERWVIGNEFSFLWPSDHMLEIDIKVPRVPSSGSDWIEKLQQPVFNRIDLAKWALMITSATPHPLTEGTIVIWKMVHFASTTAHRESVNAASSISMPKFHLTGAQTIQLKDLTARFISGADKIPQLWNLLWHFGRSCVSPSPRDTLLDAVIGLDSILSTPGGNAAYKFQLHGTALLTKEGADPEVIYKKMRSLYSTRSKVAHGSSESVSAEEAYDARTVLARTIESIIALVLTGELEAPKKGESLAKAIESVVRRRAVISSD